MGFDTLMKKKVLGQGSLEYNDGTSRVVVNVTLEDIATQAWLDGDHVDSWDWSPYNEEKEND